MLKLSLQGQNSVSQADAGKKDKEKGTEHTKVERLERIRLVIRVIKSSVWLRKSLYRPVVHGSGNLDEAGSLRTLCTVVKCLDVILKAVGSQKRSLSREVTIRFFFDKNNSGCRVED